MNAARYVLGGVDTVASGPSDPAAVYIEASIGAGKLPARVPASMRPIFDRLASNEPIALSDADRAAVEAVGVKLADATAIVRERDAFAALAAGMAPDAINARPPTAPHFKPMQPIRVTRTFVRAPKGY